MMHDRALGAAVEMDALKVTPEGATPFRDAVASEIPLTILANDVELATLLASPADIRELTYGYLYTSGFIKSPGDATGFSCDTQRWTASVTLAQTPDPALMRKRLYTSGCGKCAMYTTIGEVALRQPLRNSLCIDKQRVFDIAARLHGGTPLFAQTGAVHCAILVEQETGREIAVDDVARHNAVDKAVGRALFEGFDFARCILARTGRTSSEIVYKTRCCGISITIARGAPTHGAVHLAVEMGITLIGFAREQSFNVYSCPERVGAQSLSVVSTQTGGIDS